MANHKKHRRKKKKGGFKSKKKVVKPKVFGENDIKNVNDAVTSISTSFLLLDVGRNVRVSWQGPMSIIGLDEILIIGMPDNYKINCNGMKTFAEAGLTPTELMISGLWSGGSRDMSALPPKTVWPGMDLSKPHAYLGLMSDNRVYRVGSVKHTAITDKLPYIASLGIDVKYDELRGAVYADKIRNSAILSPPDMGFNYCGDKHEVLHRCVSMQNSYWALFYSEVYLLLNTMSRATPHLYTEKTGYFASICPLTKALTLHQSQSKTKLAIECRRILAYIAGFVRVLMRNAPSLMKPWMGANLFYADIAQISGSLAKGIYCLSYGFLL